MTYHHTRTVTADFDDVVAATEDALADEGFGVLSDIAVHDAFAEKLGVDDYPNYRILGACNPSFAKEALAEEVGLGVLLPCNVVVYEARAGDADAADGDVVVAAVDAGAMLSVVDNPELDPIAEEVNERLGRALDAVSTAD